MSRIHHVNGVLKEFGAEMGLTLELGAGDRTSLRFDDVLVTFVYREQPMELLWLYVDLGPVPATGSAVPAMLLELNLQTWLRNVMTISVDQAGARAVGHNVMPLATLDHAPLKAVLKAMLDAAIHIRGQLEGAGAVGATAPSRPGDPPMPPGSIRV